MDHTSSEEEALFRSYPYDQLYFVQSPSTLSHANTNTNITHHTYHESPDNNNSPPAQLRYSSSRGSNDSSFAENKKNNKYSEVEEEEDGGWVQYLSFGYSDSGWWVFVQLSWRFVLSLMVALVVFYVAAKPPPPKFSLQIAGIRQFRLGEGVDGSGVTTKIVSCNCSVDLIIDNDSKLFALHIHPPFMEILFGHLPFAVSQMQGKEVYAGSNEITLLRLRVGTRNKPMYGAGRNMQELLESGEGLPLVFRVSFRSSFHVVWGLFVSKFHHEAQCLVVLSDKYDKKHRTQVYNSTCIMY